MSIKFIQKNCASKFTVYLSVSSVDNLQKSRKYWQTGGVLKCRNTEEYQEHEIWKLNGAKDIKHSDSRRYMLIMLINLAANLNIKITWRLFC